MKALTICQPYPHLIIAGEKFVENRTWATRYRGPLVIHAGKSKEWMDCPVDDYPVELVFGAAVGVCRLVDCVHISAVAQSTIVFPDGVRIADHEHTCGPWCWVLADVHELAEPVECKGSQGLWELDCMITRSDRDGRDVTKLPGLWSEQDRFRLHTTKKIPT
jgi:hypothetical protein